jgi:hypothetical protein
MSIVPTKRRDGTSKTTKALPLLLATARVPPLESRT